MPRAASGSTSAGRSISRSSNAHADGSGDQPLVILGESGCGKSALLANWVTHYRQAHPRTLILQHYIGATPYSADWAAMLRRLMGELKRHVEIHHDIPDIPDALVSRAGLLTFAHDFLRAAARDAYLPSETHQRQAHLRAADYFQGQSPGPRRTDELPWQLAEARAWQRLCDVLGDRVFFADAWDANQFEVKTCWTQIEAGSPLRMVQAYGTQIEHPDAESDKVFLNRLSVLLADTGHPAEALGVRSALVGHFKAIGDWNNLAGMLGNQAVILRDRGDLDGAMALHKEEERICRQLGNLEGLATSLANQALALRQMGQAREGLAPAEEAYKIASSHGYTALAKQIEPILNAIRRAAQGETDESGGDMR